MVQKPNSDFCAAAVRAGLTCGLPIKQVAADCGIGFLRLGYWIQKDRSSSEKPADLYQLECEVAEPPLFQAH